MESLCECSRIGLDKDILRGFLDVALEKACVRDEMGYASYSWNLDSLTLEDCLALFYKKDKECFYFENPSFNEGVVGFGALVQGDFEGPGRFAKAKKFAKQVFESIHSNRSGGACLFATFNFEEHTCAYPFPAARVTLPRFKVRKHNGELRFVINVRVAPGDDVDTLLQGVLDDLAELDFETSCIESDSNEVTQMTDIDGEISHESRVQKALDTIKEGKFKKIVLARVVDIFGENDFNPIATINLLRKKFPTCFPLLVNNGQGQYFIAAAPERLLRVKGGVLKTEALAGSAKRGRDEKEDFENGKELLNSQKDLNEHQFVIDYIVGHLESLDLVVRDWPKPALKKLANVQHIVTPIEAKMNEWVHLLDVAAKLHPTPAVGGVPMEPARETIAKLENFERGLYAGAIGWFDASEEGELVVGLRSALIEGNKARLYAGGGIVEGSDPHKEKLETDIKLQAMLGNLM